MPANIPLIGTGVTYALIGQQASPIDLTPAQSIISYAGLLAMGWFFWRRETGRSDETTSELKAENKVLRREVKSLESDIRKLLSNREIHPRKPRRHDEDLLEDLSDGDDE